jgi:hypothetical protein
MRPRTLTPLLLLLLCCSLCAPAAGQEKGLTAEEIINKHLEAVGGRGALSKLKTRIAAGTVKRESDPEAKMAIVSEAPNRLAAVFIFTNFDLRMVYDAGKWNMRPQLPRQYVAFQNKYEEMLTSGLMYNDISLFNILLNPPEKAKFEAKGVKKLKGGEAYVVEVKQPGLDTMHLFFDKQTLMWVRTEYGQAHFTLAMKGMTVTHQDEELTVDFYIETSDFRDVGGLKLPFRFEQVVTAPILGQKQHGTIVGKITEYRHNEPISPQMFQ